MYLPRCIVTFPSCSLTSWERSRRQSQALDAGYSGEPCPSLDDGDEISLCLVDVGSAHLPSPGAKQELIARRVFIAVFPLSSSTQAPSMAIFSFHRRVAEDARRAQRNVLRVCRHL